MAPTATQSGPHEDEGPDSHNIWDKTFKICERYDSNASVVFTDVTEDAGSFAASQQDTLDSFYLKGEASPASSPLSSSPAVVAPQDAGKGAAKESKESPLVFSTTSLGAAKLPNGNASSADHHIQPTDKQTDKLDSLADETISVVSTTAVAGSVASVASLDDLDVRTARRSTEAGRSSTQADGPESLTVDIEVPESNVEAEEEEKAQGIVGDDLYLLTPKKQGEDRMAEGVETPPEEEEADPTKGFQEPPAGKKSAATQSSSKEDSEQEAKTAFKIPETKSTETPSGKQEAASAKPVPENESKEEGEIYDPVTEAKGTDTPTEGEDSSPVKATSEEGTKQAEEPAVASPEALEQKTEESPAVTQSPATPETAAPTLGEAEDSSQGSDPSTRVPTPTGSSSSLNPISEPFVPSKEAAQKSSSSLGPSKRSLNAQAAAFVPGKPSGAPPASVSVTSRPSFTPLQFGDLPDSLNASPHPTSQDQAEWSSQYNSYQGPEQEQGDWQAEWAEYGYSAYGDPAYNQGNGTSYYGQGEGSWNYGEQANGQWGHWNQQNGEAHGWEYEADENGGLGEYANGYGHHGANELADDSQGSRRRPRAGRGFRRFPERRRGYDGPRGSWGDAAVDILEQQFGYSRDALQEMLELHEGNLEIALDMLAQLEAEKDGQLPASGQDAPELNEKNFPSLGSCGASKSQQPSPKKADFAAAVRTPSSAPQTPHSVDKKAFPPSPAPATPKAQKQPWAETGAAVSELYDKARADAKDHARLRNQYFQEATKAYMAGSKALAKDLGAKGREQSELMKAAHVSASQAIYKHRNPISGRSKGKSPGLVDLHGLHVKEALSILEEQIEAVRRLKPKTSRAAPHRLSVLVGTGHHTKGVRTPARLPSAVEDWLKASQIPFSAPEPGILELSV